MPSHRHHLRQAMANGVFGNIIVSVFTVRFVEIESQRTVTKRKTHSDISTLHGDKAIAQVGFDSE